METNHNKNYLTRKKQKAKKNFTHSRKTSNERHENYASNIRKCDSRTESSKYSSRSIKSIQSSFRGLNGKSIPSISRNSRNLMKSSAFKKKKKPDSQLIEKGLRTFKKKDKIESKESNSKYQELKKENDKLREENEKLKARKKELKNELKAARKQSQRLESDLEALSKDNKKINLKKFTFDLTDFEKEAQPSAQFSKFTMELILTNLLDQYLGMRTSGEERREDKSYNSSDSSGDSFEKVESDGAETLNNVGYNKKGFFKAQERYVQILENSVSFFKSTVEKLLQEENQTSSQNWDHGSENSDYTSSNSSGDSQSD